MNIKHIRSILLQCTELKQAIDLICSNDRELQDHLVGLLLADINSEWQKGYDKREANG